MVAPTPIQVQSSNTHRIVDVDTDTDNDSVDEHNRAVLGGTFDDEQDSTSPLKEDFGSHQFEFSDALLARELNQLTLKEREVISEEVHGVRDQYQHTVGKETPELLRDSLEQLAIELEAIPSKNKPAYETSQARHGENTWVNTNEFRLIFLRREYFDAKKAAVRLVEFLELCRKCWGEFVLQREMCLSDFSEEDRKLMNTGHLQWLPGRDRCGRRVFIHFMDDIMDPTQPNEMHTERRVRKVICDVILKEKLLG